MPGQKINIKRFFLTLVWCFYGLKCDVLLRGSVAILEAVLNNFLQILLGILNVSEFSIVWDSEKNQNGKLKRTEVIPTLRVRPYAFSKRHL